MTPERIAEIKGRLDDLPDGAWRTEWSGQQFCVLDAEGNDIMEYTFAIPTWEPKYEAAKATCDVAVPTFVAHARGDVPDLLDALAADQVRISALEAALSLADEVARLTKWGITVTDCREGCEHPACLILRSIAKYQKARAALAGSQGGGGGE